MELATVNGVRLAYELTGDGPPLVWIAGTGLCGRVWHEHQVPYFSSQYRCLTFDLRGAGRSDAPEAPYSVPMMAEDTVALLEHVGIGRAHFVGWSLGSAIIQEIAIARPELVASAVLLATWSKTAEEHHIRRWFEARLCALRSAPAEVFRAFAFWLSAPSVIDFDADLAASVERTLAENAGSQPIHAYVNHFLADMEHDTRDRLDRISCPTLVVYGTEDLITLPWYNDEVARRIPNATVARIERAGHLACLERPAELNALVADFLKTAEHGL